MSKYRTIDIWNQVYGKVYYIFRLFATSMTTVLLPTKPAPNRTLTLFSPRSELPRERKRSPQSYSSTVTKYISPLTVGQVVYPLVKIL